MSDFLASMKGASQRIVGYVADAATMMKVSWRRYGVAITVCMGGGGVALV